MSRTLSQLRTEGGISLETQHRNRASARVEGRISWLFSSCGGFLSSYEGDLRDLLVGPQGGPVSTRISRAPYGFLCNRCRGQGPHLELRPEPQGSSPGQTWISGFLWASTWEKGLVSCGAMQVRPPLKPVKQCLAFGRVDNRDRWLSLEAPQGCHTCHCVLSRSSGDR